MSVFGPKQVEELIIGSAMATETTVGAFVDTASDKEIAVLARDGGALAEGKKFYVLQKTSGSSAKGLNYEFSDEIDPKLIDKVVVKAYAAEVQKKVTVTFNATVATNSVYEVMIRLFNDGGTLSVENFRHIIGSYVVGATAPALTVVIAGIKDTLEKSLLKEGNGMFTITSTSTTLVITSNEQAVVPGKIVGRPVEFEVEAFSKLEDMSGVNTGLLTVATTIAPHPGVGTGKYAVNLEWFTKGYKYDVYRENGYPVNFATPVYADSTGTYNVIHILYKSQRTSTVVENQHKVLTILVKEAVDVSTEVDKVIGALETVTGLRIGILDLGA